MRSSERAATAVRPIVVTTPERVRWSDVDTMGVVHFAQYLRFVEIAETELFRSLGFGYAELAERYGVWCARVRLEIVYRAPALLDDELACTASLLDVGRSSMQFEHRIARARDGVLLAQIGLTVVCLDRSTMRSVRVPDALRTAIEAARAAG